MDTTEEIPGTESFPTPINKAMLKRVWEDDWNDDELDQVYNLLYERLMSQMPYGTAKARTGDPWRWIDHWITQFDTFEELVKNIPEYPDGPSDPT
jgi:hypothetical protein